MATQNKNVCNVEKDTGSKKRTVIFFAVHKPNKKQQDNDEINSYSQNDQLNSMQEFFFPREQVIINTSSVCLN